MGLYISQLDSFNQNRIKRDRIYELLNEAVKVKAFEKYGLGAFFDPGVYKIAPSGFNLLSRSFLPAIDSMAALSNRYTDVKRSIHLVIVGYADALPFSTETALYKELKNYLNVDDPSKEQLNLALSDLRAAELLKNLKMIMRDNASKFTSFNQLAVGSTSYGRGEALPFKNVTNYTDNDERRRVVVFYWAILPELDKP
ncbi:hypothetical protein [Niabella ginsengisoli]|uniref:Uncharacterized protein n=1 Tax=Niabella ginsengisoli TaxID=522298 RepID=A0ABS9SQ20_9BACT|nr:hypothetical protein [Niabella ginsengisoli]MCH5600475.1 hypothetical protein [Niabella ginsengisoli]